jgi:hypothetical protein
MDTMLGWALVVLIIGGVVVYSVRAEAASNRPAEPSPAGSSVPIRRISPVFKRSSIASSPDTL